MNKKQFDTLRHQKNLTLEQLSEKTGIPVSTLTKISAGYVQTSFQNMYRISKALECSLDALTEDGFAPVSMDDRKLLYQYHGLTNHAKNTVQMLLQMHQTNPISGQNTASHPIFCIQPTFFHGDSFLPDCYTCTQIDVLEHSIYDKADFALRFSSYSLSPVFCFNDLIYLQYRFPEVTEIGLFQYQNKLFLRRFSSKIDAQGGIYLTPVQFEHCKPQRYESHELKCLGTVLASQHDSPQTSRAYAVGINT